MSFRGSCPEPLFSDGEARSPIFSPAVPMVIFIDKNKSQADVESLKWDDKKGKIGF